MTTLPLPVPPVTVYAPGAQVKSADLNLYNAFELAVKNFLEEGEWTRPDLTDSSPVLQTTDRTGRTRNYAGPEGYWMGPVIQETYRWTDLDTGAPFGSGPAAQGIRTVAGANVEVFLLGGQSTTPKTCSPRCRLRVKIAATTQLSTVEPDFTNGQNIFANIDDGVFVVEGRATLDTIGANSITVLLGIHSGNNGANTDLPAFNDFAMFKRASADANWQCSVGDNTAGTDVDSGVAIVADQYFTLRVELHGANSAVGVDNGTAAVARFFIDGALVATIADANVPSGAALLGPFIAAMSKVTGPVADIDFDVSVFKSAWSETLDFDAPA